MLADELIEELAEVGDANTFHGFAKNRMKVHTPRGLTPRFEVYPPLITLAVWDLKVLGVLTFKNNIGRVSFNKKKTFVENRLQALDFASGFPTRILELGSYYDAAGFPDLVLRMYLDYSDHSDHIPTYPLIVVDEYQDFNPLETAIIDLLGTKSDLLIAGDDDQALYSRREASPAAIRAVAVDPTAKRFPLPFCSRCTSVVVDAVVATIDRAVKIGGLADRLDKPFRNFPPTKGPDSTSHPKAFDVRCTSFDYIKRYVAAKIREIPDKDIREAAEGKYPAALVMGPAPFLENLAEHLMSIYPDARFKPSDQLPVLALDGYRFLARDPRSNLGWRILLQLAKQSGWESALRTALTNQSPLVDELDEAFRDEHLAVATTLERAWRETLEEEERQALATRLMVPLEELDSVLGLTQVEGPLSDEEGERESLLTLGGDEVSPEESEKEAAPTPSILFTSLVGAKGLSGAHVFVLGCSNGRFPRKATPTDDEICQFIVALSRTRKACHLISCARLGPKWLPPSTFLRWVADQTTEVPMNRNTVPD